MKRSLLYLSQAFVVAVVPVAALADAPPETAAAVPAAVDSGATSFLSRFKPTADVRARMSFADQDGKDKSLANTLRARVGLNAAISESWSAFGEVEYTRTTNRQGYQAASVHGLGDNKVVIADPESLELNQLWLAYSGDSLKFKGGIQRIIFENSRFVGNVGWRQNEQTFDGVTLEYSGIENLTLKYGYVYNVNRIFGSEKQRLLGQRDYDSRSHFATAGYQFSPAAKLTGYGYFLDLENAAGSNDSNNTIGASLTGTVPAGPAKLGYRLEYATQTDAADSTRDYRASYTHIYADAAFERFNFGVGYEILGAGDGVGFNTPLATLHAFNGFADTFLFTPSIGLRDAYVSLGASLPFGFKAKAIYHDFTAEDDSTDLGYEFDFVVVKPLRWGMTALAKAALYNAEEGNFVDTQRLTFQVEYKY